LSYDYFFFAKSSFAQSSFARGGDSGPLTIESLGADMQPIGSIDAVRIAISRAFPATQWTPPCDEIQAWFGASGPSEFILTLDEGENIGCFKAAYITREEVLRLADEMNLVAFDPQTGELLRA
jgi:hypothetical protein